MRVDLIEQARRERHGSQAVEIEQPGAQPIVDVMGVVGDVVGNGRGLRLGAGMSRELQVLASAVFQDRARHAARSVAGDRLAGDVEQRPIVLDEALQRLPRQVQSVEIGIALFQPGHDPQGLGVVVEPAMLAHAVVERIFARMAEGRVAEIVRERQRLGQIFIEPQRPSQGTGDLRHLDGVGQARAEMVALVEHEDLRLVLQAPERRRVDDPVAIPLELAARRRARFVHQPSAAARRVCCVRGAPALETACGNRGVGQNACLPQRADG